MIEFIRAVVRPALALESVTGTLLLLVLRIPIPDFWIAQASAAMTFYFVYRHEEKKNGGQ